MYVKFLLNLARFFKRMHNVNYNFQFLLNSFVHDEYWDIAL